MKHLKFFYSLFNLTERKKEKDYVLESDIAYFKMLMKVVYPLFKRIVRKKIAYFFRYEWKSVLKYTLYYGVIVACVIIIFWKTILETKITKIIHYQTKVEPEVIYSPNLKSFQQFIYDVGKAESSNDWDIVSKNGMLGYFQFYTSNLSHLGINVSKEDFLKDTLLQIVAFKRNLAYNKKKYQKYIDKYAGKPLPQDKRYIITESGILMAFHLKPAGAIRYFESGCIDDSDTDGNGTPVSLYVKKFSGYQIE